MTKDSFFLVIEGLDGSGKTSIGRHLAQFCEVELNQKVRMTYEPHDPSAGGLFIRQILEKKITNFTPETLMVSFAANRLDHCNRQINPWLSKGAGHMIICDRNYLSSLVYQTNEDFSKAHVMNLNQNARKPDLTIFMNVSNEVCYQRMKHRNKPQELFETDLSNTREKYMDAIEFLKTNRNEKIVTVDANGTMNEVLRDVITVLKGNVPAFNDIDVSLIENYKIPVSTEFSFADNQTITLQTLVNEVANIDTKEINQWLQSRFNQLENNDKGILLVDYLKTLGYQLTERVSTTNQAVYKMSYTLPGGILQRGILLIAEDYQQSNVILETISNLKEMTDFLMVLSLGASSSNSPHYERDLIQFKNGVTALFPSSNIFTEAKLIDSILEYIELDVELDIE